MYVRLALFINRATAFEDVNIYKCNDDAVATLLCASERAAEILATRNGPQARGDSYSILAGSLSMLALDPPSKFRGGTPFTYTSTPNLSDHHRLILSRIPDTVNFSRRADRTTILSCPHAFLTPNNPGNAEEIAQQLNEARGQRCCVASIDCRRLLYS